MFQSTPPSREATPAPASTLPDFDVSIHAPLMGGDWDGDTAVSGYRGFNPRPPHGRRLDVGSPACNPHPFQSTPPSQEATRGSFGIVGDEVVSIHAPLTGGDCIHSAPVSRQNEFQSTPPSREATRGQDALMMRALVSIHAPLTGGDGMAAGYSTHPRFQSTPPSREATMSIVSV